MKVNKPRRTAVSHLGKMFSMSMLPDLTPRDVSMPLTKTKEKERDSRETLTLTKTHQHHNLWYTSRSQPSSVPHHLLSNTHDPISNGNEHGASGLSAPGGGHSHHQHHHHPRDRDHRRLLVERTPLSRLRQDELLMERRRQNVSNYGSSWLKPLGVPKTLFQMREERREAEEHAEQVRREQQLAAALEAEAGAAGAGGPDGVGGNEMLEPMEEDEEGEQDLDDDIPEAEGFGFDGEEDSEEEEEEEEEDDENEENESEGDSDGDHALAVMVSPAEQEQVRDMRAAEDRMRELMERGHDDVSGAGGDPFLDAEDVAVDNNYTSFHHFEDDERAGHMLEEDDLIHQQQHHQHEGTNAGDISMGMDMDMDADLDDEIPEGDDGYEHTDSEEDISDDDGGTREVSFAGRSSGSARTSAIRRRAPRNMLRQSLQSRTSLAQSDIDISSLLSRDGSSFLEDTPQTGRRRGP